MLRAKTKKNKRKFVRRRAERLYSNIYVYYKKADKKDSWKSVAHKDISGIGVGLFVNEPLKINMRVNIAFYLKGDSKPCSTTAKVVQCRKIKGGLYQAGLEFEEAQKDTRLIEMLCGKIVDLSLDRRVQ